MTTTLPTLQIRQETVTPDLLEAAGLTPQDFAERLNERIDADNARQRAHREAKAEARNVLMSPHRRWALDCEKRGLLIAAKGQTSPALRSRLLSDAKRIADLIAADDRRLGLAAQKFTQAAADKLGISKRTVERAIDLGGRLLPDLAQAVAGGPYDNAADLERLSALPPEMQREFAAEAERRRREHTLVGAIIDDGRLRKIDHALLDALDDIERNDPQTRRRLAAMTQREAIEMVAQMQRDHAAVQRRNAEIARRRDIARHESRVELLNAFAPLFDAAAPWEKARFMAPRNMRFIPHEDAGFAFGAVKDAA
ncbi:hypothetical protein [Tardiphaga sp. vice278]|uniref:hypothetical protein n=1 Tax=Tardiphaga sp. vice278 TaxID=2592815 RepID=UPI00116446C4|nr:hypothetical protein [Tardiphaga sp. vice278]QDM17538.1 hypothetical protein FNL53_17520 [Tardiphaga sp. vice278]